jgi:phospholipid/cholesterol/gamma-HCH transport system substrate-binding protein
MKVERKVGLMFVAAVGMVIIFAALMGVLNPFSNTYNLYVQYNFAGGIETGSPVRVMGIKVGKVERIDFDVNQKDVKGQEVKLKIKISLDKKVRETVREDSQFFINLAGIIGEKFLEVTPGTLNSKPLEPNQIVRGEDPPRIDQLISQGYGLAGKIIELVNKNEGSVSNMISQLDKLTTNFNKTLVLLDKTTQNAEVSRLLKNAVKISDDLVYLTGNLRSHKAEETYDLVHRLLFRLEPVDGPRIKKFFQDEGIRARVF